MTEAEWLACDDPEPMLEFLRDKVSERKVRLFACACVRRVGHLLTDAGRRAVQTAEAYADGMTDPKTLKAAGSAARQPVDDAVEAVNSTYLGIGLSPALSAAEAASEACNGMGSDVTRLLVPLRAARAAQDALGGGGGERAAQAILLRDILGNPPHPRPPLPAALLNWADRTECRIAQAIYDDRAFDRLPILADALEDAGCTDAGILAHCRGPGPHLRGCWVVDLILGRQ
jgi:hypothetical protein